MKGEAFSSSPSSPMPRSSSMPSSIRPSIRHSASPLSPSPEGWHGCSQVRLRPDRLLIRRRSAACLAEILLFDNISEASTIGYSCMWIEVACPSDVPESPRFRVRSASTGRYTEYGQFQNPSPLSQPQPSPEAMEATTRTRMYVLKKEKNQHGTPRSRVHFCFAIRHRQRRLTLDLGGISGAIECGGRRKERRREDKLLSVLIVVISGAQVLKMTR